MKRILFDIIAVSGCLFAPWLFAVALILVGLSFFTSWIEGFLFTIILDIVLFDAHIGLHTLYMIAAFCGVYYVSIRLKTAVRVV
jgi:hypothetical protein